MKSFGACGIAKLVISRLGFPPVNVEETPGSGNTEGSVFSLTSSHLVLEGQRVGGISTEGD